MQFPSGGSTLARRKLIVFFIRPEWYCQNDQLYENTFKRCNYETCVLTDNRALLQPVDAVVVYACRMSEPLPLPSASSCQIWVACSIESPVHYEGYYSSRPCGLSFTPGGDITVYVWHIPTKLAHSLFVNSVLVSLSVFMALSTVFHSVNSLDNSPFSHSVLPVLSLSYWSFQLYIPLWKSPSALI